MSRVPWIRSPALSAKSVPPEDQEENTPPLLLIVKRRGYVCRHWDWRALGKGIAIVVSLESSPTTEPERDPSATGHHLRAPSKFIKLKIGYSSLV